MALYVKLSDKQFLAAALHFVMNVRRATRIRHGLDSAEQVLARGAGHETSEPLKILICRLLVARLAVQISAVVVALPNLHYRIAHRLAFNIKNTPTDVCHLAD